MGPFARNLVQSSSEDFEALEEAWRRRVESARDRYVEALSKTAQAPEEGRVQAQMIRKEALAQYRRLLQYFTELVMKGKIPPEGE
jgi:hypothetical protein